MSIASWSSAIVSQWLGKIGMGPFSSVLNTERPFTGKDLVAVTQEELTSKYHLDKKPAKKLISERNKALSCLNMKPKKQSSKLDLSGDISPPMTVNHLIHVEYVPGKGFMGLPTDWSDALLDHGDLADAFMKDAMTKRIRKAKSVVAQMDVDLWTSAQVLRWLDSVNMSLFATEFRNSRIDGPTLINTSNAELIIRLGITPDEYSDKLLKHVSTLKEIFTKYKSSCGEERNLSSVSEATIEIH